MSDDWRDERCLNAMRQDVAHAVMKALYDRRVAPLWMRILTGHAFRRRIDSWAEDSVAAGDAAIEAMYRFPARWKAGHEYLAAYDEAARDAA